MDLNTSVHELQRQAYELYRHLVDHIGGRWVDGGLERLQSLECFKISLVWPQHSRRGKKKDRLTPLSSPQRSDPPCTLSPST